MKHSVIPVILFCFFCLFPASFVHPSSPEINLSQSITSKGDYANVFSLHSSVFTGRISTAIPQLSGAVSPEIKTFAVCIRPAPGVSFYAGSLSSEGLPSRARKLSFSLSSPFHSPVTIPASNTLTTESSAKTGNIAFEFNSDETDIVLYSARLQGIDEPSWALFSKTFHSPTTEDGALRLSVFSGITKLIPSNETAWYSAQTALPETDINVSGAETLFQEGLFSGGITGLIAVGRFRKPAGSFRAELSVDREPFVLSAGYFFSDRHYVSLSGNDATVLSRIFFAPLYYAKPPVLAHSRISCGAIIYADSSLNPELTGKNIQSLNGGSGLRFDSSNFGLLAQGMISNNELASECTIQLKNLVPKKLQTSISGKADFSTDTETRLKAKTESIQTSLTFNPVSWLKSEVKHAVTLKNRTQTVTNEGSVEFIMIFRVNKTDWELSGEILSNFDSNPVLITLTAAISMQ
jgi:hypothetical protein